MSRVVVSGPIIHKKRALEVTGNNCVTRFVIVLMDSGVIPEIQCFGERFEQYRSAIDHFINDRAIGAN